MKKYLLVSFLLFISISRVSAGEVIDVTFNKCVDGDTAKFNYRDEVITARFLAIDTPETKHPAKGVEPFGKEASEYTCEALSSAKEIKLEYDDDSDKLDKYNRYLVWVFVDGKLLQKDLVSEGLASVAYLYGDYKYTSNLETAEQEAEDKKIGIWSIEQDTLDNVDEDVNLDAEGSLANDTVYVEKDFKYYIEEYGYYVIAGIVLIILCLFSKKARNKTKSKIKSKLTRELKKRLK